LLIVSFLLGVTKLQTVVFCVNCITILVSTTHLLHLVFFVFFLPPHLVPSFFFGVCTLEVLFAFAW
jgi:hypothetical protein